MGLIKAGDTKSLRRHAGDLLDISDGTNMSRELRGLEENWQRTDGTLRRSQAALQ